MVPKMVAVKVKAENREAFVKRFEEKGFKLDKTFSREEIINSVLPITLNYEKKEISRMGNVTCAAGAESQRRVISEEEFWSNYIV